MAADSLVELLEMNMGMTQKTLADLSDADLMTRPVAGANHPVWQLGHVLVSEEWMMNQVRPGPSMLPAGFAEKFGHDKVSIDDQSKFITKAELLDLFTKVRTATIEKVKTLSPEELAKKIPSPFRKGEEASIELLCQMPAAHMTMHLGQIQVLRRKLGKPVLF